jgi:D-tagatose-1,6-bisphosphate aldolase subunit GatZ/KbaZ
MKPPEFVRLVHRLAEEEGFPAERILLGGDHLGTNTWRSLPAEKALDEAKILVKEYVRSGYTKIHLDASFVCADDVSPITDEMAADRCAQIAKVCETHAEDSPPIYVIGTEVPTPGGACGDEELHVTSPEEVECTLSVFKDVFMKNNLEATWERVVGMVVQPGVEFGDDVVHDFQSLPELATTILKHNGMVYEAHSTDYQTAENLKRMVRDHFYVLKVGPWLTFALREGLYLLEMIEKELDISMPSCFRDTLIETMRENPGHWEQYYLGTSEEIELKLNFSYSDRARYYLGGELVLASQKRLMQNLSHNMPESLISQFMPKQYSRLRLGELGQEPRSMAVDRISNVLELYMEAGR